MKCKCCGVNYTARELRCPYCGNENPTGWLWKRQRDQAELDYKNAAESLPKLRRKMANRVLNWVLIIETVLFILLFAGVALVFYVSDVSHQATAALNKAELNAEMSALYEQERFGELYALLQDYDLTGQDYYEYTQMSLLNFDYERFQQKRMAFFTETEVPDTYTVSSLLDAMHDVLYPYIPAYPEMTASNAVYLQEQQADVTAFGKAILGLTDEELAMLAQKYMTIDEEDALTAAVLERRCWDALEK